MQCGAGRFGDQDNPHVRLRHRMRGLGPGLIRVGHYGQRSHAERMAAPTSDATGSFANFGAHPAHSIAPNSGQRLADCAEIARAPDGKYHVEPGWTTTENIRETTESLRYNDDRKRQDYDKFPPELAEQLATGPSRKLIADLEAPIDLSVKSNGDHENGESQTGPGSRVR